MECEHDKEFFNEMSGQCVVCLETDLKESRLLYRDAKQEIDRLKEKNTQLLKWQKLNRDQYERAEKLQAKLERYETALNEIMEFKDMCIYSPDEQYRIGSNKAYQQCVEIAEEALQKK